MNFWILNICLIFVLCAFFAGILIPKILLISFRKKLFDIPDERKIHKSVGPRLGGIAFTPVILFSTVLLLGVSLLFNKIIFLLEFGNNACTLSFGFCAILTLYLIGMADDLIGIQYRAKFVFQILCAFMLIAGGLWINNLYGFLGIYALPKGLGYPFSVLVIVFITNAINLIDGIDGLASGLSSIALLSYGVTFFILHQYIYSMISFATVGVLVPFFYYNVFGNAERGRKIFMGDTGSLTIGIILSFLSIRLFLSEPGGTQLSEVSPIVLAFSPLIIPCFDVIRVFFHRIRNNKNPFIPDKNHIHHKLLAIGMSQHIAMITILIGALLFTVFNIFASIYLNINFLMLLDLSICIGVNMWLSKKIAKRKSKQFTSESC